LSTQESTGLKTTMAELPDHVGSHLGYTDWRVMDQERVNQFADTTDDHQYIHVDIERAKASPFGGTIAHGYLTLALAAPVTMQLLEVTDAVGASTTGWTGSAFPPLSRSARSGEAGRSSSQSTRSPAVARASSR